MILVAQCQCNFLTTGFGLARLRHCWNGIIFHDFVGIVERKQSQWKLGDGRNVQMIHARRGYIHVLSQLVVLCFKF